MPATRRRRHSLLFAATPPALRTRRHVDRPRRLTLVVLAALALLIAPLLAVFPVEVPSATAAAAPTGLHVAGNQLLDGAGRPLLLHGVNRSGSEYACIQGWGFFDGDVTASDDSQIPLMQAWGVRVVNLPLNEDCWLGINGVPAAFGGATYQAAIRHEVQALEAAGITPVLSLFWTAPGAQPALDQAAMPDADHSLAFWQSVAAAYKGDSAVVLRLKEEPYPAGNADTAAAWRCWRDGGGACDEGYAAVGMQALVDTIRAAGATNVIQVPGIQYANSLSQFLAYRPSDPLGNLMAVVDVYPIGNICGSTSCYDSTYAPVAAVMPLVAGEVGESADGGTCTTTHATALLDWLDAHRAGYLAWAWDTWGGCLRLITDYTTGAPNGAWGQAVQARLLALAGSPAPSPSASPRPTPSPSVPPSPSATPVPSPSPSAAPATYQLTVLAATGGAIQPAVAGAYSAGSTVTARAVAAAGYLFTGWLVDGAPAGWADPLALTMDAPHTLAATFAPRPAFADVAPGDPAAEAIAQLAARGVIRGYDAATFGPADPVLRAQMAALIARAMGWAGASSSPFTDRCDPRTPANCVDPELWDAVAQLAGRGVARGYADPATCRPLAPPCYDPRSPVLAAQALSFIARAMVAQGYWQQQPVDPGLYGGVLNGTGHEQDVATFVHYTRALGGVPDYPADGGFAAWDRPATRAWFARALWSALDSYFGAAPAGTP